MAKAPPKQAPTTHTAATMAPAPKAKKPAKASAATVVTDSGAADMALGQDAGTGLTLGDAAPDFTLPTAGGGTVALANHRGRGVVVFFYPKDDTSGCTAEAKAFSALMPQFAAAGVVVIGISKDSVASHDKFAAKYGLTVTLASDQHSDVAERFGVWVKKSMYGRQYMGLERSTFLIDGTGKISQIWRKVKVPGHAEAVLKAVNAA